jgi:CRP-like cAMP-binding protein
MYAIAKGECIVNIRDEKQKLVNNHRILSPSDYFGEIAMIYHCKRTATVMSTRFSTLAELTRRSFKEIVTEFPEMVDSLKQGIYAYNDRMKRFIKLCLRKLEFFQGDISEEAIHDFMYSMKVKHYQEGDILQKPGKPATELILVLDGVVEVDGEFDGFKFVVDKLYRGAFINFKTWHMEDENAKVLLRFGTKGMV